MPHRKKEHHYRVVGIRRNETRRVVLYKNLSWETAEQVRNAMIHSRMYQDVVIEDQTQREPKPPPGSP